MGPAAKYLYHLLVDGKDRWHPLLAVYYLTYRCSFRCPYCSDGAGRPYWTLPSPKLSVDRVWKVLCAIRRHCDYLVLTGGEPLEYPELRELLVELPALRFKGVILTTNGYALDDYEDVLSPALTELVVSIDTLDATAADRSYGVGEGALARILAGAEHASHVASRSYEMVVSTVVTPDNLDGLEEVCSHAWQRGWRLAACPQLQGVEAHPALVTDERYRRFFDFLIAQKRAGRPVEGTIPYLQRMRDLAPFKCRPFTMLTVAANGDVFYPCLEIGHVAGNLVDTRDLHEIRRRGAEQFGPQPRCGVQCHSACALGFATILDEPSALLGEGWRLAARKWKPPRPSETHR